MSKRSEGGSFAFLVDKRRTNAAGERERDADEGNSINHRLGMGLVDGREAKS